MWCGVVWCGMVWCGVVGCSVVWCGVVWCGVVWCGVVWCGVAWYGVILSINRQTDLTGQASSTCTPSPRLEISVSGAYYHPPSLHTTNDVSPNLQKLPFSAQTNTSITANPTKIALQNPKNPRKPTKNIKHFKKLRKKPQNPQKPRAPPPPFQGGVEGVKQ